MLKDLGAKNKKIHNGFIRKFKYYMEYYSFWCYYLRKIIVLERGWRMRNQIFIIVLAFFCILGLWWAHGQYNQKIDAQGEESWLTYQEKLEQEATHKEQLLKQSAKTKNQTLADRASYLTLKNGEVKILLVSSSMPVNEEKLEAYSLWGDLLEDSFNKLEHVEVRVKNESHCSSAKTEMIGKEKLEEVIQSQPDILFFEICLPSEGEARGSLEVFQEQVDGAMNGLKKELPDTLIVVQTPNPFINYEIIKPAAGSSYDEYNAEMKKYIEENGWNFIDTYYLMEAKMEERGLTYKELLAEQAAPDTLTFELWSEMVTENLHLEIVDP